MPRSVGIQSERARVSVFSVVIFISIYHRHGKLLCLWRFSVLLSPVKAK